MDRPVMHSELAGLLDGLIAEIRSGFNDIRGEIRDIRGEIRDIRGEIRGIREDLRAINNRVLALSENSQRRQVNAAAYCLSPECQLLPLFDIHTSREIPGFPKTITSLLELDATTSRRILQALEISATGSNEVMMREKIRQVTL